MTNDLYNFPKDHVGRQHYVTVAGHSRSVPAYKTYMGSDRRHYLRAEYGGEGGQGETGPYIMPDKLAYVSPLDGTAVTSRSGHREHMARHSVVEAGDMKMTTGRTHEASQMTRAGADIVRAMQQGRN